jgi:hypothetical protein
VTRPSSRQRTRRCGEAQARKRLRDAEEYLEVADLVASETDSESVNVAAALVVLAGIAAQYGFIHVSASELKAALRRGAALVAFAQGVIER